MTRLPESSLWEEEIELISRSERVSGGLDGVANRPLKSLANRTRFLKDQAEKSDQVAAEKVSAVKTFAEGATLESPREEILYGDYRLVWTGVFPKTIPANSTPVMTGGVGAGCWAYTSDAIIRQNLASRDGFKLMGQADTFDVLRAIEPGVDKQSILVRRHNTATIVGGGEFYYDASDTTTEDNSCTVVVTAGGARWKRKNVGDEIHMEWAGARTAEYTDEAQDEAFENCLKAAAVGSLHGYPCRRIVAPMFGKIRLKERHYCRGGIYPLSTGAGVVTESLNGKFGVDGYFIVEKNAGFYVVQTVGAEFNMTVDNHNSVTTDNAPTVDNGDYLLRLEAFNQGGIINIDAQHYGGQLIYTNGKNSTKENKAIWPDLTDDFQGINNNSGGVINARNCGRVFNLNNNLSGLGRFDSVWEQWSSSNSIFYQVADLTFGQYETTVPHNAQRLAGSVIFNQCGLVHFDLAAFGSGGKPGVAFNFCQGINIANAYFVLGEDYSLGESTYATGIEVSGPGDVKISNCHFKGPNGRGFVVGRGGYLRIGNLFCNGISQIGIITNLAKYLPTSYQSGGSTWKGFGRVVIQSIAGLYNNRAGYVYEAKPCIHIMSDAKLLSEVTINKWDFEFTHEGFTSATDKYYVRNDSNNAVLNLNNAYLEDSLFPVWCRDYYSIGQFNNNKMSAGKVQLESGATSVTGGSAILTGGTKLQPGETITNTSANTIDYHFRFTVNAGGNLQISKNSKEVHYTSTSNSTSVASVNVRLRPGETMSCSANDSSKIILDEYNTFIRLF
ncbi:hypothetical protein ACVE5V_003343 [Klebsiella michiganensis]